jgi:hypothetical protein
MIVCRVVPSGVGPGMGVGEGNNRRTGVGVGVEYKGAIETGVGVYGEGSSGNGVRSPERLAKRDQPAPPSVSCKGPNVGSTSCTPAFTSKTGTKMSKLKGNNDILRHPPNRHRRLDKTISLLISQPFLQEDTTIQQNCQARQTHSLLLESKTACLDLHNSARRIRIIMDR